MLSCFCIFSEIEKVDRTNEREELWKRKQESVWKVGSTGSPSSGKEIWICPFHPTHPELVGGISQDNRSHTN